MTDRLSAVLEPETETARYCQNPECNKLLVRRPPGINSRHWEPDSKFHYRKYCNDACVRAHRHILFVERNESSLSAEALAILEAGKRCKNCDKPLERHQKSKGYKFDESFLQYFKRIFCDQRCRMLWTMAQEDEAKNRRKVASVTKARTPEIAKADAEYEFNPTFGGAPKPGKVFSIDLERDEAYMERYELYMQKLENLYADKALYQRVRAFIAENPSRVVVGA